MILIIAAAAAFAAGFKRAADEYAAYEVKNAITGALYESFSSVTLKYGEYIKGIVQKETVNGEVSALMVDSMLLNKITAELTFESTRRIENLSESFAIPLGNVTGIKMLSGRGPGIKIKVVPLGSVSAGAESKFISAGINQTLHRINVRISVLVSVLSPFSMNDAEISCEYVISETLIVGKVPELYYMREPTS